MHDYVLLYTTPRNYYTGLRQNDVILSIKTYPLITMHAYQKLHRNEPGRDGWSIVDYAYAYYETVVIEENLKLYNRNDYNCIAPADLRVRQFPSTMNDYNYVIYEFPQQGMSRSKRMFMSLLYHASNLSAYNNFIDKLTAAHNTSMQESVENDLPLRYIHIFNAYWSNMEV